MNELGANSLLFVKAEEGDLHEAQELFWTPERLPVGMGRGMQSFGCSCKVGWCLTKNK